MSVEKELEQLSHDIQLLKNFALEADFCILCRREIALRMNEQVINYFISAMLLSADRWCQLINCWNAIKYFFLPSLYLIIS